MAEPFARFTYTLTPEDTTQSHREFIQASPLWQAHLRKLRARTFGELVGWILCLGALIGTLFAAANDRIETTTTAALGLTALVGGGSLYSVWSGHRAQLAAISAGNPHAQPPADQSLDAYTSGSWTLSVSEDGLHLAMPHQEITARWSLLTEVIELPSFIIIAGLQNAGYPVPRSQFASKDDADAFIARVRAILADRGSGSRERLRAYFADHAAACPQCRYALLGSDGALCPECGRTLSLRDFPAAATTPPKPSA